MINLKELKELGDYVMGLSDIKPAKQELEKQTEDNKYSNLFNKALDNTNGYPDLTKLLKLKPNPNNVFDTDRINKQILVVESRLRALLDANRITLQEYNELTNG
jgi:hypothetical protein